MADLGVARAVMGGLSRVYDGGDDRPFLRRHLTSFGLGLAVTVADYGSIFGSLATAFLLVTYLYLSACAFLIGAEVDAIVRQGETSSRSGS